MDSSNSSMFDLFQISEIIRIATYYFNLKIMSSNSILCKYMSEYKIVTPQYIMDNLSISCENKEEAKKSIEEHFPKLIDYMNGHFTVAELCKLKNVELSNSNLKGNVTPYLVRFITFDSCVYESILNFINRQTGQKYTDLEVSDVEKFVFWSPIDFISMDKLYGIHFYFNNDGSSFTVDDLIEKSVDISVLYMYNFEDLIKNYSNLSQFNIGIRYSNNYYFVYIQPYVQF